MTFQTTNAIAFPILVGFLLLQSTLSAAAYQSMDELYDRASNHIKQKTDQKLFNTKITLKKVSSRLRLAQCQTPVTLQDQAPEKYFGRLSLLFKCEQPFWKFYMSANVQGELPVVMTTKGILRQAVIEVSDVEQTFLPYQRVKRDTFIDPKQVIGMRALRAIGPNQPLSVKMLQPPFWVFKNQSVRIITRVGNLKVESMGTALKDAVKLQQVDVKNNSSKKIIKGIVIAPNTVEIP